MKKRDCIIFLIWCIVSCSVEDITVVPDSGGETSDVKISLVVPGAVHPSTYAASATDENEIRTLDILAFSKNSSNVDTFCYRVSVDPAKIEDALGGIYGNKKDVTARMQRYRAPLKLVMIANASSVLDAASLTVGEPLTGIYNRLKFEFTEKWPTSPCKPFPMWGEASEYVLIQDPVVMKRLEIAMLRSIAKIDVGVDLFASDPAIGFGTHFKIKHVYVYNTQNRGLLIPTPSNFNASMKQVREPSVPAGSAANTVEHEYTVPEASANKFFNEIYVTEADSTNPYQPPVFLVIGAAYGGMELFYRVDFAAKDGHLLPLLRNFRYLINIKSISRPGFNTKAEAAAARSANLEYDLMAIDEHLRDFVFDGQYYLGLSEGDLIADAGGGSKKIWVETNYPSPWSVDYSGALFTSNTEDGVSSTFNCGELHTSYVREGTITFTAGTLKKIIRVRQYASFTGCISVLTTSPAVNLYYQTANMDGVNRYIPANSHDVQLVWEDVQNNSTVTLSGSSASVTLANDGNAVFALRNTGSGDTLWTWHVWRGYNPDSQVFQVNYKGNIFMDRNLGATTNAPGNVGSYGLKYQWGRKEPFPRAAALTGNTIQPVYRGATPVTVTVQDVAALGSNPLEQSHKRPTVFIKSDLPPFAWSSTGDLDNLWTTGGIKSVYDPCPAGWRLPTSAEFLNALAPTGGWNYGQAYEGGLVLPAAGGMDFSSGQLFDVGTDGYYWTAETAGTQAKALHIRNGNATIEHMPRASGFSVRCMKEKYE
ncbi:MAG: hypothetical protein LBP64_09375 [Tannerella sp.]|jgi:hypothetical protein|nr:hypothetical protein [Tannerella sp.]